MATKKSSGKKLPKTGVRKDVTSSKNVSAVNKTTTMSRAASSKAKQQAKTQSAKVISPYSLRKWNITLALLHAVQGVAVLLLSTGKAFSFTASYLTQDPLQTAAQGKPVLALATKNLFDLNLAYLVAAFFFLSALAHLFIATKYRRSYEIELSRGRNPIRWIEYALSASTMMVAIGLLVGVQDIALLITLFGLTAVMNLCGLIMETHNEPGKPVKWLSFTVGSIAGILPWIVIAIYLFSSAMNGGGAPSFVYWIFGSMFVLFTTFAINMWLQYKKIGKWNNYLYGERTYMILSLVAKSVLAWQVFAGTLRP